MLTCSFCNENDFDELGLEIHLANYCMGNQSPKLNSLAHREAAQQSVQTDGSYEWVCKECQHKNHGGKLCEVCLANRR